MQKSSQCISMMRCKISQREKEGTFIQMSVGKRAFPLLLIRSGCINSSTSTETSQNYCHSIWSELINPSSQEAQFCANAATWFLGYGRHMPCQTGLWAEEAHVTLHLPMQTQCLPSQYSCLFYSHCVCGVRSCHWRLQTDCVEGCGNWKWILIWGSMGKISFTV